MIQLPKEHHFIDARAKENIAVLCLCLVMRLLVGCVH